MALLAVEAEGKKYHKEQRKYIFVCPESILIMRLTEMLHISIIETVLLLNRLRASASLLRRLQIIPGKLVAVTNTELIVVGHAEI
jgi:hypothetical protein